MLKATTCFAGVDQPGPQRDKETAILTERELESIRKARRRLLEWQDEPGRPLLIEYRRFYDPEAQKHYSEYKLPIAELIRDIVSACPIGTPNNKLRKTVERDVDSYVSCFSGSSKRPVKKRQHSVESDLARAATVAKRAFERESNKSGAEAAVRALQTVFSEKFNGFLQVHFELNSQKE